jgi:hypothetical protein
VKNHFLKFIFLFAIIFSSLNSSAQNWLWARNGNDPGSGADAYPVATDASGNVYLAGWFNQPYITFGSFFLDHDTGNIYLTKYDANGNLLNVMFPVGYGMPYAVATDASGNIFMTGYFNSSTIKFGSYTLTNAGAGDDIFIVKYDPNGNVLWARGAGGAGNFEEAYGLATDAVGNVYACGGYQSPSITFGSTTLNNYGQYDLFIVKYAANGNVLWAHGAGGVGGDYAYAVSTDAAGNAYLTGLIQGLVMFGSYSLNSGHVFLAKYDPSGNVLWAKNSIDNGNAKPNSCITDLANNTYVTGYFTTAKIIFYPDTLFNTVAGRDELFLAKYNSSGNLLWAKSARGNAYDGGYAVATNSIGNLYLSGYYGTYSTGDTLIFGNDSLFPPMPNGNYAGFLMKMDSSGHVLCQTGVFSAGDDNNGLAIDPLGNNVYFGTDLPDFANPYYFGPDTMSGIGLEYPVVAKWTCSLEGIQIIAKEEKINVYPNPSNGIFQLEINNSQNEKSEIHVYNVLGEIIFQSKIQSRDVGIKSEIDLTNQPNGIYFVQINSGNKILTAKIIRQ